MRILVVSNLFPPDFMGGYELGCAQMVDVLRAEGHDVQVATTVSAHAEVAPEAGVHRVLDMAPVYNVSRMRSSKPALQRYYHLLSTTVHPGNTARLNGLIDEFIPDVAYLWNLIGIGGLGVLGLLRHRRIPWVWHLMDSIPRQLCDFLTGGNAVGREFGHVFPGRYITCSRHVVGEIRVGGVEIGQDIDIVPNWIFGQPPPTRTNFYSGRHLRIMFAAGTLCEPKGTHILIEAGAVLRESGYRDFVIDLYGSDDDPQFRRLINERDLREVVHIMGSRPHREILDLLAGYDVFAFPTWAREPFAFAPLEAAAAGCVPLMSRDCGNAEWTIEGVDCLKADRSPAAFAESIGQIIRGKVDLASLGQRAQDIAWRDFHISGAVARVCEVLTQAAAERSRSPASRWEFLSLATFAEGLVQVMLEDMQPA
jgi:glycogen synthase